MTTQTVTDSLDDLLQDIAQAYDKRRVAATRLQQQDTYIGQIVRQARDAGATWAKIAEHAKTSDVAVLKASRRLPKPKEEGT